ncbi:MAG: helix-hairpin-helix domain-containing protein [Prolixibacteraceae bacterium]|jgi:DNA uptake protein ComE-like DNA-binding protein|nr:helix-hairpin-helix domain-containing protein [Prolixibacteraceae bacterium]
MNLQRLREFFIFTRKERNGILLLLFILLLVLVMDLALPYILPERKYDLTAWREEAIRYNAEVSPKEGPLKERYEGEFDPNSPSLTELGRAGVPEGLATRWIKYTQKGGRFRKKEDIRKLYGMTDTLYQKLEGHLVFHDGMEGKNVKINPGKNFKKELSGTGKIDSVATIPKIVKKEFALVEVNQADSAQLEALPGIGPVLASRIIKYRKLLGGFYEVAQLREIYGMSDELWSKASPQFAADPTVIKKIDINFLSLSELGRHPYIGFRQAKKIVWTRDTKGRFNGLADLAILFTSDSLQHLMPYLETREGPP